MSQHDVKYRPELSGLADEILRAKLLACGEPRVVPRIRTLQVYNQHHVCRLVRVKGAWEGSCCYGQTHDPRQQPCCEARALEMWVKSGDLVDPRLMVLDETLLTGRQTLWPFDPDRRAVHDMFADLWRDIAQRYAVRQTAWDTALVEHWYCAVTGRLVCPGVKQPGDQAHLDWRLALLALDAELPGWFDVLCEVKDALVKLLCEPNWGTDLARRDAYCDWVSSQDIPSAWVRTKVRRVVKKFRLWRPMSVYTATLFGSMPVMVGQPQVTLANV